MKPLKRWITMNYVFLIALLLIVVFAYMDANQIISWYNVDQEDKWDVYEAHAGPSLWNLWYAMLFVIGIIWYIVSKDLSEALALIFSTFILLYSGLEDIIFFLFSERLMTECMDWFGFPQNFISKVLGETCVSPLTLYLNVALGTIIAYLGYFYLQKLEFRGLVRR